MIDELASKIRGALEAFWDERAIPSEEGVVASVDDLIGPIESMIAVEVLVVLDKITETQLPNSIIQAGGYKTREEFVDKLSAAVLTHLTKKSKS